MRKYSDRLLERLLCAKRPEFRHSYTAPTAEKGDIVSVMKNLAARLPN